MSGMSRSPAVLASVILALSCGDEGPVAVVRPPAALNPAGRSVVASPSQATIDLAPGWRMRSSAAISDRGDAISRPDFKADGWYAVDLPATVIAGLIQNGVYADPFTGRNLDMVTADAEDFSVPWWFRREVKLPPIHPEGRVWLNLQGLNYRANVWLNGQQIAEASEIAGAFRRYELDVTDWVRPDARNALAFEIFGPDRPNRFGGDLAIDFVDWSPHPPDLNMGFLDGVFLATSGAAVVRSPLVTTELDASGSEARLTVTAEVKNALNQPIHAQLKGMIGDVSFVKDVDLDAGEVQTVDFTGDDYPQLVFIQPALWWPWQYGEPILHELALELLVDGQTSDRLMTRFGIRQVTSHLDDQGHAVFEVNGRPILIRGAAWAPDMFQRRPPDRQLAELRYARDLNLNAIRLEGKFEDDRFFDLADEEGLLILIGWCCCDAWADQNGWRAEQHVVATESLKTQMRRLRNHPSMLLWMNGSDNPPTVPGVEAEFLETEADLRWPNAITSHAAGLHSEVSGETGLKMLGPYDWVPPVYWEADTDRGGAFGFATEISPGPAIPPLASLERMLTDEHLWPMDAFWSFHGGLDHYANFDTFTEALTRRYGAATSVADYARKAQAMAYESHRGMFEAYGRNKYRSATGVIQWMLNNPWPSMIWHLYDYYLRPGGSYFGAKKALEPLHIQYSYVDDAVVVVNSQIQRFSRLLAKADVYDLRGNRAGGDSATIDIGPDEAVTAFFVPATPDLSSEMRLLRLTLRDGQGNVVSVNSYWVSPFPDELDWEHPLPFNTPQSAFADYTALQDLAPPTLDVADQHETSGSENRHSVTVTNRGTGVAFQVHLEIHRSTDGEEVLPVLWEDGYFLLLPGESRAVAATYQVSDLAGAEPVVTAVAW